MKMSILSVGRDSTPLVLGGKRTRAAADDEAFLDNFHTHKRYLTEVMASSLNGLKVGEATSDNNNNPRSSPPLLDAAMNVMMSPAHTETAALSRDDTSTLDSPMSDDSDESVGYRMGRVSEVSPFMPISNTKTVSTSTAAVSPVLPRRNTTSISGYLMGVASQQQTPPPYTPSLPFPCSQPRVKDSEGRLPPSPSDPCQSADLRRAALMRSLQMRSQSPIKPVTTTPAIASQTDSEKAASAQVLEGGAQLPEQTGCNSEVLERSGSSLFPSVTTRASTRVRSLLLDEPNVVDTVEISGTVNFAATSSTTQEQEIIKKGSQEARFESVTVQQQKGVRGCSKLGNVAASDGNTSDSESKQPSRRPSAATAKKSSKRAKRL
ncbi:unnamed protein product [Sphagnum troendelagicum]|uniref:Uncharacterized protein n=1 Tax=Sphagnum troendelagicum TaxID=128251 RepID=A0ABP0TXY5_9BRYO